MRANRRRVVVTGIGAVTPIGVGKADLWKAVQSGRSAIAPLTRFDANGFRSQLAAEVTNFDVTNYVEERQSRRLDRFSAFTVAAGMLALQDAGIAPGSPSVRAAAVTVGSALGGIAFGEAQYGRFLNGGLRAVEPSLALTIFGGAGATNLAIVVDARGPTLGNADSCASGLVAVGEAVRLIQRGDADLAIAGGAEAPLAPLTYGAFSLIRAMSARNDCPDGACRPFDAERDGFVMGEGAALLVLEELETALAQGRRPYVEICGYGLTNDAWHMAAPRPDGAEAARAMVLAMTDAGIAPSDVEYVNAHATGTPLGDQAEALAIRMALAESWQVTPVSSTKAQHGHALGATGVMELAITAMAMQADWLPPTRNLHRHGDDCELRHVPAGGLATRTNIALCNAFGFGGINACLAVRRVDQG